MPADVLAATLIAPGELELRRYPYPDRIEPGAVLLRMLASGICGTDKHAVPADPGARERGGRRVDR
jgi:threonine dehydrogenase-like Zn-dependent dehydrogenase